MSEQRSIMYTNWEDLPGSFDACLRCQKKGQLSYGVMQRRRVVGRDGDTHTEYKIICRNCGRSTQTHRTKMLTDKEWEGRQRPGDGLKHRNRVPQEEA